MSTTNQRVLPAPPNLIRALLAGFDSVVNHVSLIGFSIALDLVLWFGPQVRLAKIFNNYFAWLLAEANKQSPQILDALKENVGTLSSVVEQFNLIGVFRTLPVGIPSLMSGISPVENPLGIPGVWEPRSFLIAIVIWIGVVLLGLLVGTYFFSAVMQAALKGKIAWLDTLRKLPRYYVQVLLLGLFWIAVLAIAALPVSCILPFLAVGGANLGRLFLLIYGGILIWLIFPLVFSPFGIFIFDDPMWSSVLRGARLARFTLPNALLFILVVLVLSQGLDMVWGLPSASSWWGLVGILGHAFIATSLLASMYYFYADADRYVQQRLEQIKA